MNNNIYDLAKILWDYNNISVKPKSADALIVMGTNDLGVPRYAAKLVQMYKYRWVIVTGGVSHEVSNRAEPFGGTEAEVFRRIMIELGCPDNLILVENRARNTGANILESKILLDKLGIVIVSGQLVHTPSMQRRSLATAQRQWDEVSWLVSGQSISFEEYIEDIKFEKFIHGLVGDTIRILEYPSKGFQIEQTMPYEVRLALDQLIKMGFTNRTGPDWANLLNLPME
ncbi:YdcF family protein [Ochrobactrum sp. BTU1]|uniref:YdcF family protein n=1 Tax=Ochrobactrum sp. BTU1 TaxID=2840456 RepID=UPI001C052A8D|nr:YdcF family protein [Ochrobactrum sp. BTU1]